MSESSKPKILTRLANDYHSTRTYVKATGQAKRVASQKQAAEHELADAYQQTGAAAWESDGVIALPESAPVRDAQAALKAAESALAEKQAAVTAAEKTLASETATHTEKIATLETEHRPLADAAVQSAKDLAAAQHGLATIEGQIGQGQAELARLGADGASGDDVAVLEARRAKAEESRTAGAAKLSAATDAHRQAVDADKAKAAEIKAVGKTWQSFQSQCKSELKAAGAPPPAGNPAKVAEVTEKLAAKEKEYNQTVALLQRQELEQGETIKSAAAEVEAARKQLADVEAQIGRVTNQIAGRQLQLKLADLGQTRQTSATRVAEAKAKDEQASNAAAEKAGQLETARQEWLHVKAKCDGDLSAAQAEQTQAQQAVEAARGPLADAQRALGQAVVAAGLPGASGALAEDIDKAKAILSHIAGFDSELVELKAQAAGAKGGTKEFIIAAVIALVVLAAIIVGVVLIVHAVNTPTPKKAEGPPFAPPAVTALAEATTRDAGFAVVV